MTEASEPFGAETPDVLAVDAAVTALAQRRSTSDDPALMLLAEFARQIDVRADAIGHGSTEAPRSASAGLRQPVPAWPGSARPDPHRPASTRPAGSRRRLLRVLLSTVAGATVVLLAGMLPVNASPSSPLHPLHELIFQPDQPTPEQQVRTDLGIAAQVLDDAGQCGSSPRTGTVDQARQHLSDARGLLSKVDDATTRASLQSQLASLERRADDLAQCDANDQGGPGGSGDHGQDQQPNGGGQSAPSATGNDGQQGGAGHGGSPTGDPQQSGQ
jgi:hypothetical protein